MHNLTGELLYTLNPATMTVPVLVLTAIPAGVGKSDGILNQEQFTP